MCLSHSVQDVVRYYNVMKLIIITFTMLMTYCMLWKNFLYIFNGPLLTTLYLPYLLNDICVMETWWCLMVSVLDFRLSGPGFSPYQGHCIVFLGKTPHSDSASLHTGV